MAIVLNDNIRINAGKAAEAKYLNLAGAPYTGTSQVLSEVSIGVRHPGLTALVGGAEYWFRTGVTNSDLILKSSSGGGTVTGATNGLNKIGYNIVLGGPLTGNTTIDHTGFALKIGAVGSYASTGSSSFAAGYYASARGEDTTALGKASKAEGKSSTAIGYYAYAYGDCSVALNAAVTHGNYSFAAQRGTACGGYSTAFGKGVLALGDFSFAGGQGTGIFLTYGGAIRATGKNSFNFSTKTFQAQFDWGALASGSTILGGANHNIASGNTGAAIIGGNFINLTGTTYINTTAVKRLAIMSAPAAGTSGMSYLVRDSATGIIKTITGATGGGGATVTANNGLTKSGNNIHLGGALTGDTVINANGFGIAFGTNATSTGTGSISQGCCTVASGPFSHAGGYYSEASGDFSFAHGRYACAIGQYSQAFGYGCAIGDYSHVEGSGACAFGFAAHAEGHSKACGDASHAEGSSCSIGERSHSEGSNTRACGNYSHAEGFLSYAFGSGAHSEGKYSCAQGDGSHAGGHGTGLGRIWAGGFGSFNHSTNFTGQTSGFGANACASAILGGYNHHIASGNTRAAIIGGNTITLTGTTYVDTTAVGKLAIMTTPAVGTSGMSYLVRDSATGIIKIITGATGGGPSTPIMELVTISKTLNNDTEYAFIQSSVSAITVSLPSSPADGKLVTVKDVNDNAEDFTITINGNGRNIDGGSTALITSNGGSIGMIYNSSLNKWVITTFVN